MQHGLYSITPTTINAMKDGLSFMVLYDDPALPAHDGIDETFIQDTDAWNAKYGLNASYRRMLAHHTVDRNGHGGYVLKDSQMAVTLLVPDEVLAEGYDAVLDAVREAGGVPTIDMQAKN